MLFLPLFLLSSVYSVTPNTKDFLEAAVSLSEHSEHILPTQPTHQLEQLIDNGEQTLQTMDNGLIKFADSKSPIRVVAQPNSNEVTFLPFKESLTSNGWKLSSDGKIVLPSGYKILDEYIVPDTWKSTLPSGFYQSENGDIFPKGYVVKNDVVVPEEYVVTKKAILPQGWIDGGMNAFAVPKDWLVDSQTGKARPPISPGFMSRFNGGFPKTWKRDSIYKKWIAPEFYYDYRIQKAVPKEIRYTQGGNSRLWFPENVLKEIQTPKGKVLIPGVFKYERATLVPPGFKMTRHGRVIPTSWFEDVETGVVAPPGLDSKYFGEDLRLKLAYRGKLDRLAPDGKRMLKNGFIKSEYGDVIPATWTVEPGRIYLPPSFKSSRSNILFKSDNLDSYGNIYGADRGFPWYNFPQWRFDWPGITGTLYMRLPWSYLDRVPLHAPNTYSVVNGMKLVYPKNDFVYNEISGTFHHKHLHRIKNGPNFIFVPKEEYSFNPAEIVSRESHANRMLMNGYIRSSYGDVIPAAWTVKTGRIYLPPSFKSSGSNILFKSDNLDFYGNIYGADRGAPWYSFPTGEFRWTPISQTLYMRLPWRYQDGNQFVVPLHAPNTYSVVKERLLVYPKNDFVYNEITGTFHHKHLHWIDTGSDTILVPKEEYLFNPAADH